MKLWFQVLLERGQDQVLQLHSDCGHFSPKDWGSNMMISLTYLAAGLAVGQGPWSFSTWPFILPQPGLGFCPASGLRVLGEQGDYCKAAEGPASGIHTVALSLCILLVKASHRQLMQGWTKTVSQCLGKKGVDRETFQVGVRDFTQRWGTWKEEGNPCRQSPRNTWSIAASTLGTSHPKKIGFA